MARKQATTSSKMEYGTLFQFEQGYRGEPKRNCVGIVTSSHGNYVRVQDGRIVDTYSSLRGEKFTYAPITQKRLSEMLEEWSQQFEANAKNVGGSKAAIEMRRKFDFDQFKTQVQATLGGNVEQLVNAMQFGFRKILEPKTGIYVIAGRPSLHDHDNPSKKEWEIGFGYQYTDSVAVQPRMSEYALEIMLNDLHPDGFGQIPAHVAGNREWDTVRHDAIEISSEGVDFLPEDLKKLVIKNS